MPHLMGCANADCTGVVKYSNMIRSKDFGSKLAIKLPAEVIPSSRCRRIHDVAGKPILNSNEPVYLQGGIFIKEGSY